MKKVLCVPCANGLRAEGKTVRPQGGKSEKATCEICGRRRFSLVYEVTGTGQTKKKG